MKIIRTDNFNREDISERLVAENIEDKEEAVIMLKALRATCNNYSSNWYQLKEDDYELFVYEP